MKFLSQLTCLPGVWVPRRYASFDIRVKVVLFPISCLGTDKVTELIRIKSVVKISNFKWMKFGKVRRKAESCCYFEDWGKLLFWNNVDAILNTTL